MNEKTKAFVQGLICIDLVKPGGRSCFKGHTLAQVREEYPGAEIVEIGPWIKAKEVALGTPAKRITPERFKEMLYVLPPDNWQRQKGGQSFELCEHTSGRVTAIFCAFGDRYYEFQGIAGQTLAQNAATCGETFPPQEGA